MFMNYKKQNIDFIVPEYFNKEQSKAAFDVKFEVLTAMTINCVLGYDAVDTRMIEVYLLPQSRYTPKM